MKCFMHLSMIKRFFISKSKFPFCSCNYQQIVCQGIHISKKMIKPWSHLQKLVAIHLIESCKSFLCYLLTYLHFLIMMASYKHKRWSLKRTIVPYDYLAVTLTWTMTCGTTTALQMIFMMKMTCLLCYLYFEWRIIMKAFHND